MTAQIDIGGRRVGDGTPVFIIAEVGINHDGDVDKAERMIEAASAAGADAVKFQTYRTDSFVAQGNPLYTVFKRNELSEQDVLSRMQDYANRCGILFFSSATDFIGLERLQALDVPVYKVSSANLTNLPLMRQIAATGKPVIISAGGATLGEIARTYEALVDAGAVGVAILKCTSLYPCPPQFANLRGIETLKAAFDAPIGYSDHTEGTAAALAAVALGASIIERHFTLDKLDEGHDHYFSADPKEMKALVDGVRDVEEMLGAPILGPVGDEISFRKEARRSITAVVPIPAGTKIEPEMLALRRPQDEGGVEPDFVDTIIGRVARSDISAGSSIRWENV